MTIPLSLNISDYAPASETLTGNVFGARYISYRNIDRFLDHTDDFNLGLIVWPGGTLAETRTDRYGFEFDGLYAPSTGKPGLDDMLSIAVTEGTTLSIIVPTVRYADRPDDLAADLRDFLADLLGGTYGPLPDEVILELGSEYYAWFEPSGGMSAAEQYAKLADIAISEISVALADPSVNVLGADLTIAVQSGKTPEDDLDIRDTLSEFSLSNVDMVIHHRFAFQPEGIDPRIEELTQVLDDWASEVTGAGGDAPELFVSAWNVASVTRNEVLEEYLNLNPELTAADIDLDGRTTTEFEQFWQDTLEDYSFGDEHPAMVLEMFASYAEAGMTAGALYGVDLLHPGRISWRDQDFQDHVFAGGEMLRMIYESVGGTQTLQSAAPYDQTEPATLYAFENADKLIVFVAAGHTDPGEIELSVEGLSEDYTSLWAESLTSETEADWMSIFGIPDNPLVDETPEAGTYALGVRSEVIPNIDNDVLSFDLQTNEVIRLAFAKTEVGANEIQAFSQSSEIDLGGYFGDAPSGTPDDANLADALTDLIASEDGGGGGGGIGMILLLPLILLGL